MWTEHVNDHTWQRDPYLHIHPLIHPLTRPRSAPPLLDRSSTQPPDRALRVLDNPPSYPPNPLSGRDPSYGGQSDEFDSSHASDRPNQYMYVRQTVDFHLSLTENIASRTQSPSRGRSFVYPSLDHIPHISFVSDTKMATTIRHEPWT